MADTPNSQGDVAAAGDEVLQNEAPSKNALKKAAKEAGKAEARAKKKADKALSKVTQGAQNLQLDQKAPKARQGANYNIGLKNTDQGVVTRFPPEPSGYLHLGHAKAALLNDYFAHEQYQGTLLLRFDDTNPRNEKEEFQDAIVEDLALMGITPDRISHTSDYFEELYQYCVAMIKSGNAYAEDAEKPVMDDLRMNKKKSERRDESIESNLTRFEEMKLGSDEGQRWCIRAKIKYDSSNGALRDPVIYRCIVNVEDEAGTHEVSHHRTGTKWKVYPTYDFCCPIVDSLEGVTHALRTSEYRDRNPQYEWVLKTLNLRQVAIWDFAKMNFVRTLLSKRKLTKLVKSGAVYGWDDPRFPTIRGIRRRGMTVSALRDFMLQQGPSRNVVNMDWTIFWTTNKKFIDPVAPRHTAIELENAVKCHVMGASSEVVFEEKPKHIKNPEVGVKKVAYSDTIWIEQGDALRFSEDEEITLMAWGNAFVRKITKSASSADLVTSLQLELHLEGDVKKTDKKVTWLSDHQDRVLAQLVDFDFLITKDKLEEDDNVEDFLTPQTEFRTDTFADCNVADVKADDIIQFERKGYFRCDRAFGADGSPAVFFQIPTGKAERPA